MSVVDVYSSSISRPLALRLRRDLTIVRQESHGSARLLIKDELTQRYWLFSPEEAHVLELLRGSANNKAVCLSFNRAFAPRRLSPQELTSFLSRLHGEGLLLADREGQTEALLSRKFTAANSHFVIRAARRLLWWKLPCIDPDRWLRPLTSRCSFFFTPTAAILYALLLTSALAIALRHWTEIDRELRNMASSFAADDALVILLLTAVVKIVHELAHAITCNHFGGRCREMGLMGFLGAPALYCNVSDAWLLPDRRSRIAISAAGVLAETAVAAVCGWLWLASQPGLIHSAALYAMILCSLNTMLLNGNPLMHFDGYHILADWIHTPNLRAQGSAAAGRLAGRALLGLRYRPSGYLSGASSAWLAAYGIASFVYRAFVIVAALWFLHGMLERFDLNGLIWPIAALVVCVTVLEPAIQIFGFLGRANLRGDVPWGWVLARFAAVGVLAIAAVIVPFPCRVVCPVVLEPRGARTVYVEVDGRLQWAVAPGTRVQTGDLIARLENVALAAQIARVEGEVVVRKLRLQNLLRTQADPSAAALIPTSEKSLADAEKRLSQQRRDYERLAIRAPRGGIVLPPEPPRGKAGQTREGTALDRINAGCYLRTGDVLCVVGEPSEVDAVMYVGQSQADLIAIDQRAAVLLDTWPQKELGGTVQMGPSTRAEKVPAELFHRGEIAAAALQDAHDGPQPKESLYAGRIEIDRLDRAILAAATGRASIAVAPMSLGGRAWRSVRQTFGAW